MLAFIRGKVAEYNENYLVIEASGVGYEMTATANAVFKFSPETGEVLVPTYMAVREDSVTLFGFADNNEKSMFLKLITVSGVGPKLAVTVLSSISSEDLAIAIATSDLAVLSKIKGLGKKTAEKIVVELREKIGKIDSTGQIKAVEGNSLQVNGQAVEDACVALASLGLSNADALKLVQKIAQPDMTAEEIIKMCLKDMAR